MAKISNLEELCFFCNYDEHVVENFLEIAFQYLNNNVKSKSYSSAALKLDTDPNTVANVVEKLAYLLLESEKLNICEDDFNKTLETILPLNIIKILWAGLNGNRDVLQEIRLKMKANHDSYTSLDWRLQCTLASRSIQDQRDVHMLMCLNLKEKNTAKQSIFLCDIPNLIHMTEVLESALNETKSSHIRKIQRSFN